MIRGPVSRLMEAEQIVLRDASQAVEEQVGFVVVVVVFSPDVLTKRVD